tara:strand:+ start:1920 stop:2069 length:150 start_codon:yes stop_codon:yes gene_type:complete
MRYPNLMALLINLLSNIELQMKKEFSQDNLLKNMPPEKQNSLSLKFIEF